MVNESFLAHIIEEKFLHHTPVHRIINKFKQAGVRFVKSMNPHNWIHRSAEELIPVYHLLEKELREQKADYETRFDKRQEITVPILLELGQWMRDLAIQKTILPKSLLGKTIAYSLNRWEGLCAYTQDGKLEIDNNYIRVRLRRRKQGTTIGFGPDKLSICQEP